MLELKFSMNAKIRNFTCLAIALFAGVLSLFAQQSPPTSKSPQAPVSIIAGPPAVKTSGLYTAVATGGSGTGALVWELGSDSTADGAGIDPVTGVVKFAGPGTVVFHVYRAGDDNYDQSAPTADFTLTVLPDN
jgi:hypothetical protein